MRSSSFHLFFAVALTSICCWQPSIANDAAFDGIAGSPELGSPQCQQDTKMLQEGSSALQAATIVMEGALHMDFSDDFTSFAMFVPQDDVDVFTSICVSGGGKVIGVVEKEAIDCKMAALGASVEFTIENIVDCYAPSCKFTKDDVMADLIAADEGIMGFTCEEEVGGRANDGGSSRGNNVSIGLLFFVVVGVIALLAVFLLKSRRVNRNRLEKFGDGDLELTEEDETVPVFT
mmetsp:Transcript_22018/g.36437  ORF Transcript_22018/g.36437 Transcript_22018/m.36437 type:complete len:233 (+) Transcript_22018:107-805(+)